MYIEIEEIFNISKEFIMDKEWLYRYILKNSYKIFETNNSKKYWKNIYYVSKLYNTLNPDTLEYALYKMIDLNDEKLINISIMHLLINKINKNKTYALCRSLKKVYKKNNWDYSVIQFHLKINNAFINDENYNVGFQKEDLTSITNILKRAKVINHNEVYSKYPLEFQKVLCQLIFYYDVSELGLDYFLSNRSKKIINDFIKYNNKFKCINDLDVFRNDILITKLFKDEVSNKLLNDVVQFFENILK